MSILTHIDSVASFVQAFFPEVEVKYFIPKEPKENTLVIRAPATDLATETRYSIRTERDYQLVYYTSDIGSALERMDVLSRKVMDGRAVIPINDGSMRYIRVGSFSYGYPVETEGGLFAIIGVMPTETRQARTQETYEQIQKIATRFE